jgi:signal transduction histidine kinase
MLIEFIGSHRDDLISRTRAKVRQRLAPRSTEDELMSGVPLFLDQLVDTLRNTDTATSKAMDHGAAVHGAALLNRGYTVAQVVHDYGDICQVITELAEELEAPISTEEFHTLNLCLDNAIAEAVTEYMRLHDQTMTAGEAERSGVLAHELRNKLSAAQLGFLAITSGRAPTNGSVAAVVTRSLQGMTGLVNRAMVEVRLDSGTARRQRIDVSQIIEDAGVDGTMAAGVHGVSLTIAAMRRGCDVNADPQILAGALANLLQNAFKFTSAGGHVSLRARVIGARVEIDVEDECGGLPPGKLEELFGAFQQRGKNRSGLGLGLFISRKGVEACGGEIRVRDRPGVGCVFTIDLPVLPLASSH